MTASDFNCIPKIKGLIKCIYPGGEYIFLIKCFSFLTQISQVKLTLHIILLIERVYYPLRFKTGGMQNQVLVQHFLLQGILRFTTDLDW